MLFVKCVPVRLLHLSCANIRSNDMSNLRKLKKNIYVEDLKALDALEC